MPTICRIRRSIIHLLSAERCNSYKSLKSLLVPQVLLGTHQRPLHQGWNLRRSLVCLGNDLLVMERPLLLGTSIETDGTTAGLRQLLVGYASETVRRCVIAENATAFSSEAARLRPVSARFLQTESCIVCQPLTGIDDNFRFH